MSLQIGRPGESISVQDQGVNWRVQFWYRWNDGDYQFADVSYPSAFQDLNPDEVEHLMVQLTVEVLRGRGLLPDDPVE